MKEILKKNELVDWCWEHLEFNNCPENWTETYIVDILEGYKGQALRSDTGEWISYSTIRENFIEYINEYVVIASNNDYKNMYITKDLEMVDSLSDKCIWNEDYDVIDDIISKDAQEYNYTYEIEEF